MEELKYNGITLGDMAEYMKSKDIKRFRLPDGFELELYNEAKKK
jgi:hypothetical protein